MIRHQHFKKKNESKIKKFTSVVGRAVFVCMRASWWGGVKTRTKERVVKCQRPALSFPIQGLLANVKPLLADCLYCLKDFRVVACFRHSLYSRSQPPKARGIVCTAVAAAAGTFVAFSLCQSRIPNAIAELLGCIVKPIP